MQDHSIRLALLDDHALLRDSLAHALTARGVHVVLNSGRPVEFVARIGQSGANVALVDLALAPIDVSLPDGHAVVAELRARRPDLPVVVLSDALDPVEVDRCIKGGAQGYLTKAAASCEALVQALGAALRGERIFPATSFGLGPRLEADHAPGLRRASLTEREREVLAELSKGLDNQQIAAALNIAERTVKAHVASLYRKLQVDNRVLLALAARQLGIVGRPGA